LVIKTLDPYRTYPDPVSLELLDPDPDSLNPDLQLLEKEIFEDDSSDLLSNTRTWIQRLDWIWSRNPVANAFRNIPTQVLPIK
jgi:hypothetical protein